MIETNILDEKEKFERVKIPANGARGEKKMYERLKAGQRFVGGA